MAIQIRLIQLEMYLPNVASQSDLTRALGALKRHCKAQHNVALSIEAFNESDRGEFSIIIVGTNKQDIAQESDHLINWIEEKIIGQTLASNIDWV